MNKGASLFGVFILAFTSLGCETTAAQLGLGTYVDGHVSARAVTKPLPAAATFYVWQKDGMPSMDVRTINECIATHMSALGMRQVEPDADPQLVVAFAFDNGGTPIGYRAKATSPWPGEAQATSAAVWDRRFELFVFDGASGATPKVLWQGEVASRGSSASAGPVAFTFLERLFTVYGSDTTRQHFRSPLIESCRPVSVGRTQ